MVIAGAERSSTGPNRYREPDNGHASQQGHGHDPQIGGAVCAIDRRVHHRSRRAPTKLPVACVYRSGTRLEIGLIP
jgi:hypothetical protein